MSSPVRLETWTAVLALLVAGSTGDVASQVVARGALLSSRVGVATLVAADAAGIQAVLVLSTSARNADWLAKLVRVEAVRTRAARAGASRCQLEPPDRASNTLTLPNLVIRRPRNAIKAGRGANPARIGSNQTVLTNG